MNDSKSQGSIRENVSLNTNSYFWGNEFFQTQSEHSNLTELEHLDPLHGNLERWNFNGLISLHPETLVL